jgi:hypothetical protein
VDLLNNNSIQTNKRGLRFMKFIQGLLLTALALAAFTASAWGQNADPQVEKRTVEMLDQPSVTREDIQSLKDAVEAQRRQIQYLTEQLKQDQLRWQQTQAAVSAAANKAAALETPSSQDRNVLGELKDIAYLRAVNDPAPNHAVLDNAVLSLQDPATSNQPEQVFSKEMESSITIRFKGINITPGGFAAAEFVRRSRALAADVTTPFNSVTMPGASQSSIPEFFGSARQSRPTIFVEGRLKNVDFSSYVSGDFLSAGVTSTATSTNGYTFRIRQAWGQARFDNGWSVVGGQMWSLVTENQKGLSPSDDTGKANDVRPRTIDSSYNVGFNYARQYGVRVAKNFSDKVAIAVAIENPQATLTTHGNSNNFLLGEPGASNSYNNTFNYSFNPAPDVIAKIAFDPGFGHYEIFGLYDRFADRIFPCVQNFASAACGHLTSASAIHAYNASKNGGGIGATTRWAFFGNHIVFGLKGFGGSGIGRYAPGGLPDAAVNPDGSLHLVKNLQGLGTLEWKGKKLDLYSYGGVEYASRTWGIDSTNPSKPVQVGYGAPGFNNNGCYTEAPPGSGGFAPGSLLNCTADTRALMEGTVGFWYRFYSGPRGRFQYGTQFSYLTRNTWSGNGRQPNGIDSMIFTSLRYYLP